MASIRNIANCIELAGNISIRRDFFGYALPPPNSISLLNQVKLLKGKHIDLNLIHVAFDSLSFGNSVLANRAIAAAIQIAREKYAQVNLGIGRIRYYFIRQSEGRGREIIRSDAEAIALTREWTVKNNAFDVFLIHDYVAIKYEWVFDPISGEMIVKESPAATIGLSSRDGPCDKDSACKMTGSVVSLEHALSMEPDLHMAGIILAHEVGHYLKLEHDGDPNNLMFKSAPNGEILRADQGSGMVTHCFVKEACS
jgi:hypothetical protein